MDQRVFPPSCLHRTNHQPLDSPFFIQPSPLAPRPSPLDARPSTPPSGDEVLVRVEGVSKKFCRSLKKSLWYGVCDITGELLPGRKRRETRDEGRELSDRSAQDISRSPLDAGLSTAAASALDSAPWGLPSPRRSIPPLKL